MKDWIIKMLGGYTKEEVGGILGCFDDLQNNVDVVSAYILQLEQFIKDNHGDEIKKFNKRTIH